MKYFDEEKMGEIRKQLEQQILKWPGVSSQGDAGMPLLPARQEHASVPGN
jgi:hypothetical protein